MTKWRMFRFRSVYSGRPCFSDLEADIIVIKFFRHNLTLITGNDALDFIKLVFFENELKRLARREYPQT
ncbi:MAG: hypothetical protein SV686_16230 [Thermodesulfobacteriota bacterium]|nr:hypothetical protein [Thermodesulfobacteriota bacterium]